MAKHNLPAQATPFVGREEEIADISALLDDPNCHLLTLCGSGGIGKTRLAIEVAIQKLNHFTDGIWIVNLEPLTRADEIVPAVMAVLGLKLQDGRNLRQQLFDYLSRKHILLIMDNFEHLLDSTSLVTNLLNVTSGLKILVTSRETLKLREEWIRHLQGLEVPDHEQVSNLESYSAVQLFVAGAHRVRGDFSLTSVRACVVRLCQMVEGLPLALELATSWLRVMPCAMIINEMQHSLDLLESPLENMPARHRSIRAVFDQSWRLLSGEEQEVFKNLAIFRGGFLQDATSFVSGATRSILLNLVEKALLRVDADGRYHLHSLLRQYAEEKLRESTKDYTTVCNRHCQYYTDFLYERRAAIWLMDNRRAHMETGAELDNIRRAMAWGLEQGNIVQLGKAISTFTAVCYRRSLWQEGSILYERIASLASSVGDKALLGGVLASQGWFAYCLSDYDQANHLYKRALSIGRQSGWKEDINSKYFLMLRLSEIAIRNGELENARQYIEEISTADNQSMKSQTRPLWLLETRGRIEYLADNYQEAQKLLQEALTIAHSVDHQSAIVVISNHLGDVYLAQSEYASARSAFVESLAHAGSDYWRIVTRSLIGLGLAACYLEENNAAWSYFAQALEKVWKNGDVAETLNVIVGIGEFLLKENRETHALELLMYAHQHPKSDWEVRKKVKRLLNRLENVLPTEVFAHVRDRANKLSESQIEVDGEWVLP